MRPICVCYAIFYDKVWTEDSSNTVVKIGSCFLSYLLDPDAVFFSSRTIFSSAIEGIFVEFVERLVYLSNLPVWWLYFLQSGSVYESTWKTIMTHFRLADAISFISRFAC